MLILVSEQCADRSNNCIRHFQLQYSFEVVFTGLSNISFPPQLRTSFARLMTHLYVDRYPHDRVLSVDHSTYFEDEIEDLSLKKFELSSFREVLKTDADKERIKDHIKSIVNKGAKEPVEEFFNKTGR